MKSLRQQAVILAGGFLLGILSLSVLTAGQSSKRDIHTHTPIVENVLATAGQATFQGLTATISGNLIVGNTGVIQPAYGPLQLQYKSGLNSYTTGLFLQDTTGNIGIGTTLPSQRLDIQGGNLNTSGAILTSGTQRISGAGALSNVTGNVSLFTNDMGYVTVSVPSGFVGFFNLTACPSGWTALSAAAGRVIVGRAANESIGSTIGTPLASLEDRTHTHTGPSHTHTFSATSSTGPTFMGKERDDCNYYGCGQVPTDTHTHTVSGTTSASGTNATGTASTSQVIPYIQYLVCLKN